MINARSRPQEKDVGMHNLKNGTVAENNMVFTMDEKKRYQKPELKKFGRVGTLTMAGSGLGTETGQPGNCSQNNRKPCR
jgi:hypothetical protein